MCLLPSMDIRKLHSSSRIKRDPPAKYKFEGAIGDRVGFVEIDTGRVKLAHQESCQICLVIQEIQSGNHVETLGIILSFNQSGHMGVPQSTSTLSTVNMNASNHVLQAEHGQLRISSSAHDAKARGKRDKTIWRAPYGYKPK